MDLAIDLDGVVTINIAKDGDGKYTVTSDELPGLSLRSNNLRTLKESLPGVMQTLFLLEHGQKIAVKPAVYASSDWCSTSAEGARVGCYTARRLFSTPHLPKAA